MEMRKASPVLVLCIMLGLLVGKSRADDFKECYERCFLKCAITHGNELYSCATKCLSKCIIPNGSTGNNTAEQQTDLVNSNGEAHSFCRLGCAISSCSNFSTVNKPAGDTVASCVNSCEKTCTRNYSP